MQKLMEEMKLEPAGMASANVPLRFGRLLGAARVIQGAFIDLTDMQLRISAGLVPVKAQGNMQTSQVNGSIDNLFVMEKDLVFSLIDEMGIRLSQEERDEIARIPTENIMAFMAYCRGLDAEDRGQFQEAANYYSQAVKLDPSFTTAQKPLQRTSSLAGGQSKVMALAVRSRPQSSERGQRSFYARQAHLKHIGDLLNKRFLPGLDTRKATKDENQTDFGDTDRVQLEVRVTLPVQQP